MPVQNSEELVNTVDDNDDDDNYGDDDDNGDDVNNDNDGERYSTPLTFVNKIQQLPSDPTNKMEEIETLLKDLIEASEYIKRFN